MTVKLVLVFLFILAGLPTEATLAKSDKKKVKQSVKVTPSVENVFERQLVTQSMKASDIIKEHASYSEVEKELKRFDGITLAYVTPWNSHGYDVAKMFANKFTYVSPVWLSIHLGKSGRIEMHGEKDVDEGWMQEVTKSGNSAIVPRVIFSDWSMEHLMTFFSSEELLLEAAEAILEVILKRKFGGVVIELWTQLMDRFKDEAIHFLGHLKHSLQPFNKKLLFVLPAPVHPGMQHSMVSRDDFARMAPFVDAFSLVTYDFSQPSRPGANSPVKWMQRCIEELDPTSSYRHKLLLGFNFYGYLYTSSNHFSPIIGSQFIEVLQRHKPKVSFDAEAVEHFLKFTSKGEDFLLYYPSLFSINERLKLARGMGVGVSIWEAGQGLDYFYDLL